MREELISFETAKLAKEKGFNLKVRWWHYTEEGNYDSINCVTGVTNFNGEFINRVSLPTQSLLQKWLREEHNINIGLTFFNTHHNLWSYRIHYSEKHGTGNTYELSLEKGLIEALKLINQTTKTN